MTNESHEQENEVAKVAHLAQEQDRIVIPFVVDTLNLPFRYERGDFRQY